MMEKRIPLNEQLARAERIRKGQEGQKILKMNPLRMGSVELLNYHRTLYIDNYCYKLMNEGNYHIATINVIKEGMENYNIKIDKFLIRDSSFIYSYNATVILMMISSGLFSEDDYLTVANKKIENAFKAYALFDELKKEKQKKHRPSV